MSAALLTKRQAILPGSLQLSPKRRCKIRHFCLQISGICTCKKQSYSSIRADMIFFFPSVSSFTVTGKPPVPLQTKNKRKRGTSCENSSFFVFCISTRPASLLARLFHLGNPLFAFFRKLLRPWKQILQEIQIRIIHVFRNLGQQIWEGCVRPPSQLIIDTVFVFQCVFCQFQLIFQFFNRTFSRFVCLEANLFHLVRILKFIVKLIQFVINCVYLFF